MDGLILRQMEVGPAKNYQYFIGSEKTREVAVVDPAWDVPFLLAQAEAMDVRILHVLVSHGHGDHVNGVEELVRATDATIHVHGQEVDFWVPHPTRRGVGFDWPASSVRRTQQGDTLAVGDLEIGFMHTPGHTPGSQSFRVRDRLVTGDTLFIDGCGRCDFAGGDPVQMYETLHDRILRLPASTVVLPGHNYAPRPSDTLEGQTRTNRFFLARDLDAFVKLRMNR